MIVLRVENLKKSFGTDEILKNVTFTLQQGQRMGLVGVNGCGKTTLLKVIAGLLEPDEGSVSIAKGLNVGYMEQKLELAPGTTVLEEAQSVFAPLRRMEERMRALEQEMSISSGERLQVLGSEYDRLQTRFEERDGYAWPSLTQGALMGMGFPREQWTQDAATLSGGEKTRLGLCKLLLSRPDILLLDEPTNHLDLDALTWLEEYLSSYPGAVLVVSHDRYFLDKVTTDMTEILLGVSESYRGNYTVYMSERAERFESRMKAYELQQQEIARQEKVIARLRSFNREKSIRRAESRQKMLDKVERLERPMEEKQSDFSFTAGRKTGEDVLRVRDMAKSFGGRKLFDHADFEIFAGDRIALMGKNGVGKSTLLKCLVGEYTPDKGTARWGANVDVGYYDQQQESLHSEKTVLRELWDDHVNLDQAYVRGILGLFLFTGDDVFSPVSVLSGGEKGRLALAKLMLRHDNVLLLDEPTNHLDMDSREVLEDALEDFSGTILAVSHDRYFINRFADRVFVLTEDGIEQYSGNYDDYLREKERLLRPEEARNAGTVTRTAQDREKKKKRLEKAQLDALRKALAQAEAQVAQAEEALKQQEERMSQPEAFADAGAAEKNARLYEQLRQVVGEAYSRWEKAAEALEEIS